MKFETSERGFKHLPEIETSYGHKLRCYESSSVEPSIWIAVDATHNENSNPPVELHAHLRLDQAVALRDQLTFLIDNHFSGS